MFTYTRNEQKWFRKTTPQPLFQHQAPRLILFLFYAVGFDHMKLVIILLVYYLYVSTLDNNL